MNVWARVGLVLFGLIEGIVGVWVIVQPPQQPINGRGSALVYLGLPIGLGAIGVALFGYRKRGDADDLSLAPDGWPNGSDRERLIVGERIGIHGRYVRLMLDPWKRIVYFERLHTPTKTLATPEPFYCCPADEILLAELQASRGGAYLHILTTTGGCDYYGSAVHKLEAGLRDMGAPNIGGSELRSGLTIYTLMFYGMAGFVLALVGMQPLMGDLEFYGRLILGGAIGAGGAALLIQLGQTLFGLRLAVPLLGVLFGAVGLGFLVRLSNFLFDPEFLKLILGRDHVNAFIITGSLVGAVAGAAIGGLIQRGRERTARATAVKAKATPEL